ncbi:hypothetical protein [Niallia circulans]|uniref:hypothetical protein n=1 Tax=Niallia circulans TaxID=1397 RepID=UPI0026E94109|nr:hypothetical protein [Niallia circulans]
MVKVQKNFRIEKDLIGIVFPLIVEGLQAKTDKFSDELGIPSRLVKETDAIEFMIKETFKKLLSEGHIDPEDPDLEQVKI